MARVDKEAEEGYPEQYSEQYPEVWATNLKAIVDKLQQQMAHGGDQSQQQSSSLFYNVLSQNQQLFTQALEAQAKLTDLTIQHMARVVTDGQSISVKELDPDVAEVAESTLMAKMVEMEKRLAALEK